MRVGKRHFPASARGLSENDYQPIEACNAAGVTMVFTATQRYPQDVKPRSPLTKKLQALDFLNSSNSSSCNIQRRKK